MHLDLPRSLFDGRAGVKLQDYGLQDYGEMAAVTPFPFAMGSMDDDSLRRQNTLRSARQFSRGKQNFPG